MKKALKIILFIALFIVIIISSLVIWDLIQENKLNEELVYISELTNAKEIDIEEIYDVLNRTITKGDYKEVEKSFKNYLKDNFDNTLKIAEILNDENLVNILTAENYKNDGKDFLKSKQYIEDTKNKLTEYKNTYLEFFTEEKAMSYIEDKKLDEYYIELYKEEYVGDIERENGTEEVEKSLNEILDMLNIYEEVINMLSNNQNAWEIVGENIVFDDTELSNKYDELINKL